MMPKESLAELVDDAAREFGDAPLWISIDDGTRISHGEFAALTLKCANALRARGVERGTHVAVMLPSVPAYAVTWFALARLGAVMIPVNTQYKPGDLEYVLRDSDARFLVIDESCVASFAAIEGEIVPAGNVIVHGLPTPLPLPDRSAPQPVSPRTGRGDGPIGTRWWSRRRMRRWIRRAWMRRR
jgi:acyl-CoA synthetase (AMP-forming)/AMP-acid ligase II